MKRRMALLAALLALTTAGRLTAADVVPAYALDYPPVTPINNTANADENAWLAANAAYVAMAACATSAATSVKSAERVGGDVYQLAAAEVGFAWERVKPEYYLGDCLAAPEDVDWRATYERYAQDVKDGAVDASAFLFNTAEDAPCVYAADGGTHALTWILKDGAELPRTYTFGSVCQGRPKRIYWTDYPHNGQKISLQGKFVQFFGNANLVGQRTATVTNTVGGVVVEQPGTIVEGLYLDGSSMMLEARGRLTGQVLMVYYDDGNYDSILHVQTLEICQPDVIVNSGVLGTALRPDGRGYNPDGLQPRVTAGVGNLADERGDYLYQHAGRHSYSPMNGAVFPIRPTEDQRWKAEITWMETDPMGVQWPFEIDQYNLDWPKDIQRYVRGNLRNDLGADIVITNAYTAELQKYQEPDGHAMDVDADGRFRTIGEGRALLKLTGDDNVWFMPIRSIMRDNADFYTLKPSRVNVGAELELRSGTRSGLASNVLFTAAEDRPGYVYQAATRARNYDVNLYSETNANSAVYAVSTAGDIEVWWSEQFLRDDMPASIAVPVLPQVYTPIWPEPDEAPQIVIASQKGSANEMIYARHGAAYFDAANTQLRFTNRQYFGEEGGTLMFWTRAAHYNDPIAETNAPTALVSLGDRALRTWIVEGGLLKASVAGKELSTPMPRDPRPNQWHHVAVTFGFGEAKLYLDGAVAASTNGVDAAQLAGELKNCIGGSAAAGETVAVGRELAEILMFNSILTDVSAARYRAYSGFELGLTGYYSFRSREDLDVEFQLQNGDIRNFRDRVNGGTCVALNAAYVSPGAPAKGAVILPGDAQPTIYYQNDRAAAGYNPNDEHAFVRAGSGGYVVWALRSDLATADTPPPAVFAEYTANGRNRLQFFHVVATNETWPALGWVAEAGKMLPGPHPLDYFENPWLPQDNWESTTNAAGVKALGPAYRDRKGQIWARAAGLLDIRMYYAMQEGFYFPSLEAGEQPAVGTPIPWLARHENPKAHVLDDVPAAWWWNISWPTNVNTMKIGQTLTTAADDLPEVWNAKSISVVYPVGSTGGLIGDVPASEVPVMLSDPTVVQQVPLSAESFKLTGLSIDANGGLTYKGGKYHFTELPPALSSRLYYDNTTQRLCFIGERVVKNAGATILYPNVLSAAERTAVLRLVRDDAAGRAAWIAAVEKLATAPVLPNTMSSANQGSEVTTTYQPVDHYSLAAMGPTNYVVIIENDASDEQMAKDPSGNPYACPVADGDAISMHVFLVTNLYYTGRIVTREDEVNLLSQQLSVLYTEPFGGAPDDFEFEWRHAPPNPDGTIPADYENGYAVRPVSEACGETAGSDPAFGKGLTRFVVGQQGDTLANMVNTYWICRYRAVEGTPAYNVMSNRWSAWCAPPALAEGWVQRVLNNVTPFNQRMTDLYENKAETAVSMIQQAGAPFTGDVALNQDNLTSVGLIQLYETILNKAESMSLLLGINDAGANKQLQLAVERLGDLYKVLGDEAYSDAKNPTIGFGEKMALMDQVDFASEASSLFCFDNQVNSLLDEELCLLRGRSGVSAPTTRMGPYYNRLLWNFTKGITAGEVAYAVNYNVSGTETVALSEEQAARVYPQGHGDAYGHYLSALKGWYRLLRNPYFSWGRPAQGEMNVADSAINVDYYEEAKFAEAAADLAKTAADVVDLSARKAWRDNGKDGSGYLDSDATTAFGFGEWASRGGYGALVNWATANSILPEDCTLEAARTGSAPYQDAAYEDKGLMRIDRGTVDELGDLCENAARIQAALDRLDAGVNPLGLSDNAVPFDISPSGASDGSNTHFEQVRDRAKTALANARKVLDRAQTQASRMRMISETAENYRNEIASEEEDYDNQLIGYYGTPYSDDIGPGKTYKQGYEGPDLIHYMWMDLNQYGLGSVSNETFTTLSFSGTKIAKQTKYDAIRRAVNDARDGEDFTITYEVTRSGFIKKPDSITGHRAATGTIQQKYADMLLAYYQMTSATAGYKKAYEQYEVVRNYTSAVLGLQTAMTVANEALLVGKMFVETEKASLQMSLNVMKAMEDQSYEQLEALTKAAPSVVGAGLTVVTSPRSLAEAAAKSLGKFMYTGAVTAKNAIIALDTTAAVFEQGYGLAESAFTYYKDYFALTEQFKAAALDLNSAYWAIIDALQKLEVATDAVNAEIGNAEAVLAKREQARRRQVDQLSQLRYNEMLFRKFRDKSLTRYSAAFDLAQKYVYMAAQAYDYETALKREDDGSGDAFMAKIVSTRQLGAFDSDGEPIVADDGDLGLSGYLAQMDANWQVLKPRLGINNPQPYTTWFSLRGELFRILDGAEGDKAWAKELTKHWVDDIARDPEFKRYCQPFVSQFGLKEKEPGLIIPFETTIDFAKNLFGNDLAGGDHAYDSTWYSTRIAAAGVWFDGYNAKTAAAASSAKVQLAETPVVYLVPVGYDCLRAPGLADGTYWRYSVVDQVIAAPYDIGSYELDNELWMPSMNDADWEGGDATVKIRKHPSFRAYFNAAGGAPTDDRLDATRLIGRSVWNTRWLLVIPAGSMNADREKALSVFINGQDTNRDNKLDLSPVTDIKIGFRTYSQSGN